jgi:hypothetical protein
MTIEIHKEQGYDILAAAGYMFVAFRKWPPHVRLVREPMDGTEDLEPGRRIRKIGDRRPGFTSGGFAQLEMLPGAWLEYAGRHTTRRRGDILLFDAYENGRRIGDEHARYYGYRIIYVGFYDLGEMLCFCRTGQTTRGVAKTVEYWK